MPRNGSGSYSRAVTPPVNGDVADADLFNSEMNDMATALTNSLARNGEATPTANLPMNGFKHTGLGKATAATDSLRADQGIGAVGGAYYDTTGSSNAYVVTTTAALTAYAAGQTFLIKASFTNTGAATLNVDGIGAKNIYKNGAPLTAGALVSGQVYELSYDDTQFQLLTRSGVDGALAIADGRLTLTTAVPVTVSDVTAATTLYYTPYQGNRIALYDGTQWGVYSFAELSIAVPATTSQMYDVFAYSNAGVVALEVLAWTNDTTRATALTLQDGVLVKTGATTRRYIGSFRTTGTIGQTEDSKAKRYVWNMYNRRSRFMQVLESTDSWTYTTDTWRQANGAAANQLDMVRGLDEDMAWAEARAIVSNSTGGSGVLMRTGVGLDSTTAFTGTADTVADSAAGVALCPKGQYTGMPGIGRHYLSWLEKSTATGTTTWLGDSGGLNLQSGIQGEVWA